MRESHRAEAERLLVRAAVEPLIRESLELAATEGDFLWPETEAVGGWWNRRFSPEIDLIGADRAPVAGSLFFAGSVKWLATPFDQHDLATLEQGAVRVPGFTPGTAGLVVATRSGATAGITPDRVGLLWGPRDIVTAWPA
ncbi:hypothetical protein [Streptomyces sp. NPDC050804]|uniref:hypothetical protein n=1 Tax=unclassified Streptomyces TaxID=2593676 RepID=UPI00341D4FE5|nr:hypothetical protein OG214_14590 [Streptomyces sp. NBC_00872]